MIDKSLLKSIVHEWASLPIRETPQIRRHLLKRPLPLESDLVLAIQGVRRCGKSTLLRQLMDVNKLKKKGRAIK